MTCPDSVGWASVRECHSTAGGCLGLANSPFTQLSDDVLYRVTGDAVDVGAGISGVPIGEIAVVDAGASVHVSVDLECERLNAMDA